MVLKKNAWYAKRVDLLQSLNASVTVMYFVVRNMCFLDCNKYKTKSFYINFCMHFSIVTIDLYVKSQTLLFCAFQIETNSINSTVFIRAPALVKGVSCLPCLLEYNRHILLCLCRTWQSTWLAPWYPRSIPTTSNEQRLQIVQTYTPTFPTEPILSSLLLVEQSETEPTIGKKIKNKLLYIFFVYNV